MHVRTHIHTVKETSKCEVTDVDKEIIFLESNLVYKISLVDMHIDRMHTFMGIRSIGLAGIRNVRR